MKTRMEVPFYIHNVDEEDIKRVNQCLRQPFLATGGIVEEFERDLAKFLNLPYTVGVSSCTAALHLSLISLGVGPGNEVITTPLTYIATAEAIEYTGARPVFVDVNWETGLVTTNKVLEKITPRTKAIIPVHLYGELCKLKIKGIPIIEDAAHALETEGVGHGDLCCFSFYPVKSITCGDGGSIGCKQPEKSEELKSLRMFGTTRSAWNRYEKKYLHWDMDKLGYKYTMTNIDASLLIGQLVRANALWEQRKRVDKHYRSRLGGVKGIRLLKTQDTSSKLMLPIIVEDTKKRDKVMWSLQEKGVGVGIHYNPAHLMTWFRKKYGYKEGDFRIAEEIGHGEISLPIYPKITPKQVDYVCDCVKETMKEV